MRTTRMTRTATLAALAVLAAVALAIPAGHAANPSNGKLNMGHQKLTWSGGPLVGTAAAVRRVTCDSPLACDDFLLDVDLPSNAFAAQGKVPVLSLTLTPSAASSIDIIVCAPGDCIPIVPGTPIRDPNTTDYAVYSAHGTTIAGNTVASLGGIARAEITLPRKGTWMIRAGCEVCAGATYTVEAKVVAKKQIFANTLLPGLDPKTIEGAAEPGIEIGPKGEIWVNGPGLAADFWSSYDKGKKWTLHQPVHNFSTGDTWLTIGPTGTVYGVNLVLEAGLSNHVYISHDEGKTWETRANLPAGAGEVPFIINAESDRQWITADPLNPGTVYFQSHDFDPSIWVYKSTDDGKTWLPASHVGLEELISHGTIDSLAGNTTGPIFFAPDGKTMYFQISVPDFVPGVVTSQVPTNPDFPLTKMYLASSTDGGTSWTINDIYDSHGDEYIDHGFSPMSVDKAGNLYIAWSARPVDDVITTVYLAYSKDKGKTWSKPIQVSQKGNSNVFPAIGAKGDPGRVSIAWLESAKSDFNDPDSSWVVSMAQTADAFAAKPTFTNYSVSKDVVHTADICQAGTLCLATSGNRNLLDYIYMDVDKQGMTHVVYTNDLGELRTVYAQQTGGISMLKSVVKTPVKVPVKVPSVKGTKTTRDLAATGVGDGMIGLVPIAIATLCAAYALRVRRKTA
jgi:hypothetical protein